MGLKKCFYCNEDILAGEGKIVPLDRPYLNIWAHRETCANAINLEYLQENIDRVYEFFEEVQGQKIKKK